MLQALDKKDQDRVSSNDQISPVWRHLPLPLLGLSLFSVTVRMMLMSLRGSKSGSWTWDSSLAEDDVIESDRFASTTELQSLSIRAYRCPSFTTSREPDTSLQ